jgi:hypothetical protein
LLCDWHHVAFKSSADKRARNFLREIARAFFSRIADEISTCGNRLLMNFSHDAKSPKILGYSTEYFF